MLTQWQQVNYLLVDHVSSWNAVSHCLSYLTGFHNGKAEPEDNQMGKVQLEMCPASPGPKKQLH